MERWISYLPWNSINPITLMPFHGNENTGAWVSVHSSGNIWKCSKLQGCRKEKRTKKKFWENFFVVVTSSFSILLKYKNFQIAELEICMIIEMFKRFMSWCSVDIFLWEWKNKKKLPVHVNGHFDISVKILMILMLSYI